MVKQRFSSLDVAAVVAEIRPLLVGLRLQNIYDITNKTFLFKFARSDVKELLLVEAGIRAHTTQFAREKASTPSSFCAKLRKHLRTRRLTGLDQVGMDRVVDMRFGDEEYAFHVILEFYSSGNIILTDCDYKIMSVLRMVEFETNEDVTRIAVGSVYKTQLARLFEPMDSFKLMNAIVGEKELSVADDASEKPKKGKKDAESKRKSKPKTIRNVLRDQLGSIYGPTVIDHCILKSGIDASVSVSDASLQDPQGASFLALLDAFKLGDDIMLHCMESATHAGYIFTTEMTEDPSQSSVLDGSDANNTFVSYQEFHPYLFSQFDSSQSEKNTMQHIVFPSFNNAVDEYFSKIEAQRLELRARQAERTAAKKLESAKNAHLNHIQGLETAQESNMLFAQAIEANLSVLDSAIHTVRSFVASGMDWKDLHDLIRDEAANGNQVASMIVDLKLESGRIIVGLKNPDDSDSEGDSDLGSDDETESDDEENEEDKPQKMSKELLKVELDIYATAYANASRYYDMKKIAIINKEKTIVASERALKHTEKKLQKELNASQKNVSQITKIRKAFWFERFLWFISSENYLVVAGRDANQTEMLITKYLKEGDVLVHSEMQGAAAAIVKNCVDESKGDNEIPMNTLVQAGTMSVCQSRAWDSKIVTSAYWVNASQVTKTSANGDRLLIGAFQINGKKNWLLPTQLVYGIGLLFQVDDASSIERHFWDRRPWGRYGGSTIGLAGQNDSTIPLEDEMKEPNDPEVEPTREYEKQVETIVQQTKNLHANPESMIEDDIIASSIQEEAQAPFNERIDSEAIQKHISAKERRQLKSSRRNTENNETLQDEVAVDSPVPPEDIVQIQQSSSSSLNDDSRSSTGIIAKQTVRGKKGKLKKAKSKYADQDEEDRQLMLELLGSAKGPQPKGKKEKAELQKKLEHEKRKERDAARWKAKQEERANMQSVAAVDDRKDSLSSKKGQENAVDSAAPAVDEDDETIFEAANLDGLTGQPTAEDVILHAIPVCAPWTTLQKYNFKVKLTPGSLKRGKAAKSASTIFLSMATTSENTSLGLKSFITAIPDQEWITAMIGKVKLVSVELNKKSNKKGRK